MSDFGISRLLTTPEEENITKSYAGPVRWMAPESLSQRYRLPLMPSKYSVKSDVWSFGVTVWETFSRARKPYMHTADLHEVIILVAVEVRAH